MGRRRAFPQLPHGHCGGTLALDQERQTLEDRVKDYDQRFDGDDVPLPPFWGGFRVAPTTIEFWQGRASRLHDRLVFTQGNQGWETVRLYP